MTSLARDRPMGLVRLTLVLGALSAFGPLSMDLYLPQLPELAESLDTSAALAQATMSVTMIGLGLGQLIAGPLSDQYGRKRPLVTGVAMFAVFSVLCAFAPNVEMLLVARFAQGLAGSAGVVICLAIARDLFSGVELSRMLSLLAVVSSSTPIIAPVIGGQLARVMDWRGVFLVLGGIGFALLAIAVFGLRETLDTHLRHRDLTARNTAAHMGTILRDPLFLTIMVAGCLGGFAFFAYLSMSPFVLQGEFGLSPQAFSLFFALNAFFNLGGSQISRVLVRRLGTTRMYLTGQVGTGVMGIMLLAAALLQAPAPIFLGMLALYLGSSGLGGPNGTTLALSAHGQRAGTASALLGTSMFTVGGVIAPIVASIAGTHAISMTSVIAIGSGIAMLLGLLVVRRIAPNREAELLQV